MYKMTKLISWADDVAQDQRAAAMDALLDLARASADVARALVAPTEAGSLNGGDALMHLQFSDATAYRRFVDSPAWTNGAEDILGSRLVHHVDSVAYQGGLVGSRAPQLANGIYRVWLIALDRDPTEEQLQALDADFYGFGKTVKAIRNWQISRADEASGLLRWTHVWEQEYVSTEHFFTDYMMHPYHWSRLPHWGDIEYPDPLINPLFCSSLCVTPGSMIAATV